jgi:hypothetical protein
MEDLPLVMQARDVQAILGLSKTKVYELLNRKDFPTICIDKRMVVSRDAFFDWLNQDRQKIRRRAIIYV